MDCAAVTVSRLQDECRVPPIDCTEPLISREYDESCFSGTGFTPTEDIHYIESQFFKSKNGLVTKCNKVGELLTCDENDYKPYLLVDGL